MARGRLRLAFFALFLLFLTASSESEQVRLALIQFMENLSPGNLERGPGFGWNSTSDPCTAKWQGVTCDGELLVKKIVLNGLNLTGVLNATALCTAPLLSVLSLHDNGIGGSIPGEISNCRNLSHLYLNSNGFSGDLPSSFSQLRNLKRLVLSNNSFSGPLPNMSGVSVLSYLVQNNQFSGVIPELDFSTLELFNVSYNNLSGPIPDVGGRFTSSSFLGNPELCGKPLSNVCPPPPPPPPPSPPPPLFFSGTPPPSPLPLPPPPHHKTKRKILFILYAGCALLALVIVSLVALFLIKKKRPAIEKKEEVVKKDQVAAKGVEVYEANSKDGGNFSELNADEDEYSTKSMESLTSASSLVVLSSPLVEGLTFKELLGAPAELVGRGNGGSLYMVKLVGGVNLAVKRVKNWEISKEDFEKRMERIDQVKHPNVLPALAYYCSKHERLLVYEFQQNGSLFSLLHGSQNSQRFNWGSRVNLAAKIADALAFAHQTLHDDGIAHGNLKSSNILLNKDMEPCISEYGLKPVENPKNQTIISQTNRFKSDVYGFGVILLELLAGYEVQNDGFDLASWVQSVVSEDQKKLEVFDKALVLEGASEERLVKMMQVALKCLSPFPDDRPSIDEVDTMIRSIKEEEEEDGRSTSFDRVIK
ncbi:hypothetical protein Vadar_005848 [Vaccinium darrowii]|uniref:Uncharacterized protein n=1 Tax=Vaccinium darrowii TaxID=229202 RepID=A0ACB7YTM8_9ERIC|nr:hypothetical protein Vadar_005848 [Vaccinium darrowii]